LVAVRYNIHQVFSREDLADGRECVSKAQRCIVGAADAMGLKNGPADVVSGTRKVIEGERDDRNIVPHLHALSKKRCDRNSPALAEDFDR
jgi:hypothetical protein